MEMSKEKFVEILRAEGLSEEAAQRLASKNYGDINKEIEAAQEQKIPTRGEMLESIHELREKSLDKAKRYKPDFSIAEAVLKLKKELDDLMSNQPFDTKKAGELSRQILSIKINGTVTNEMRQAEIDKTLEMPVAELIAQRKKYEKIVAECEEKIDNFDVSGVQAKVDALGAEYRRKAKSRGAFANNFPLSDEYNKKVDAIELEDVTKPLNNLKIKRYEAVEYLNIYEARIKFYVRANKELIDEEIVQAKREEIRGSLADLAEYVEE